METQETANKLLKDKYDLHKQPEVDTAARRTFIRTGEKVPQDPLFRIQNYLDRFREIVDRKDPDAREHGISAVKRLLYSKFVSKPSEIPESYWENQRRILRERGQAADLAMMDEEELKRQNAEAIIADQRSSLDKWVDYLSSPNAPYSDGFKYYTLRSVLNMGEFDKEKGVFTKRSKGTVKPFPDLNREALAYVLNAIEKKYKGYDIDLSSLEEKDAKEFEKLLQSENFARLYAWAIDKVTPVGTEVLSTTDGEWIKYNQGSDHMPLVQSLQGHGTGWCTAGESTAEKQLKDGDFYVYYSLDGKGKPTVPRVAIRMEDNRIAEVRGIAPDQNLDPGVTQTVEDKLKEFPDREAYKKRVHDMKLLTKIEHRVREGVPLNGQELRFLYEVDSPIEGFGYQRDPRIEELKKTRNPEEDMPAVFDCEPSQIARNINQINQNTKAYVGNLEAGILDLIRRYGIEQVYIRFPEGKIKFQDIEIGGRTSKELKEELKSQEIIVPNYAEVFLDSSDFTTLPSKRDIKLVTVQVSALGLSGDPSLDEIYQKAKDFGLELCPAEVGPYLCLLNKNQPGEHNIFIGMRQITDSSDTDSFYPIKECIFELECIWNRIRLLVPVAYSTMRWSPENYFVFALRNIKS